MYFLCARLTLIHTPYFCDLKVTVCEPPVSLNCRPEWPIEDNWPVALSSIKTCIWDITCLHGLSGYFITKLIKKIFMQKCLGKKDYPESLRTIHVVHTCNICLLQTFLKTAGL